MPNKRNTYGLDACTDYTLRVCGKTPCEYHRAVDESKKRGITLEAYINFLMQSNEVQEDEQE